MGSYFLDQGVNLCLLHWMCRVFTHQTTRIVSVFGFLKLVHLQILVRGNRVSRQIYYTH